MSKCEFVVWQLEGGGGFRYLLHFISRLLLSSCQFLLLQTCNIFINPHFQYLLSRLINSFLHNEYESKFLYHLVSSCNIFMKLTFSHLQSISPEDLIQNYPFLFSYSSWQISCHECLQIFIYLPQVKLWLVELCLLSVVIILGLMFCKQHWPQRPAGLSFQLTLNVGLQKKLRLSLRILVNLILDSIWRSALLISSWQSVGRLQHIRQRTRLW